MFGANAHRLSAALVLAATLAVCCGAARAQNDDSLEYQCPILDSPYRTASRAYQGLELGYLPAAPTSASWGDLLMAEAGVWGEWFYWENDQGSDILIRGMLDATWLSGDSKAGAEETWLSEPLTMARVSLQWSQRFVDGFGLQMEATPGLYTTFESLKSDDFGCPVRLQLIKALSSEFAVFAGATVYPRFETQVDPLLGIALLRRDWMHLAIAYPESRFVLGQPKGIRLAAGAKFSRWQQYNMGDDAREFAQTRDTRVYGGLELGRPGALEVVLHGGYAFERTIEFGDETKVEIDDAPYFRFGIQGLY